MAKKVECVVESSSELEVDTPPFEWLLRRGEELGVQDLFDAFDLASWNPRLARAVEEELELDATLGLEPFLEGLGARPFDLFSQLLFSRLHSWLWQQVRARRGSTWRAGALTLDEKISREALEAIAFTRGGSDLLDRPLGVFYPFLDFEHAGDQAVDMRNFSLADVLSGETPLSEHVGALPRESARAICNHLNMRLTAREITRTDMDLLLSQFTRTKKNIPPAIEACMSALVEELERYRDVHGITAQDDLVALDPMDNLGSGSYLMEAPREGVCGSGDLTSVASFSLDGDQHVLYCTCEESERGPCALVARVALEALGGMFEATRSTAGRERLEGVFSSKRTGHILDAFIDDLERPLFIPEELDGEPAWFGWRVEGSVEEGFRVRLAMVRGKKRSEGVVSKLLGDFGHVTELFEDITDPTGQRLLLLWDQTTSADRSPWHTGASAIDAIDLLVELAGQANTYYHTTKTIPLEIEVMKARVVLDRDQRRDAIAAHIALGDMHLTLSQFLSLVEDFQMYGNLVYSFDDGSEGGVAKLVLMTMPEKLRANIEKIVSLLATPMPASAGVMRAAPRLGARAEVELGASLRGERHETSAEIAARIGQEGDSFILSLQVSPLPGGPSFPPGKEDAIAYALTAKGTRHAVRDFEAEELAARALCERLGLEAKAWEWEFEPGDELFELISLLDVERAERGLEVIWDRHKVRAHARLSASDLELAIESSGKLFRIGGDLSSADVEAPIPLSQLLAAAREQRGWVRLDDHSWAKMEESLTSSLARLGALLPGEEELSQELSPLVAPSILELAASSGAKITGPAAWIEYADRIEAARTYEPPTPAGLVGELRTYQREGFVWASRLAMWANGACLADDMGLGKTIQAIALLLHRGEGGPALIIGPTSLGFNWARELEKFAPSLSLHLVRASAELTEITDLAARDIVYMSYDLAARNEAWCNAREWRTMVLDEAQAIKNHTTQRARAIHDIEADFTLALTGTPLENHTGELWSLMRAIAPGLLGNNASFKRDFQLPIEQRGDLHARATLAALISPFVLRRVKSEVARDLPDRTDIRLDVELSSAERAVYEELRRSSIQALDSARKEGEEGSKSGRFELLAALTRLRQLACHVKLYRPDLDIASSKVEALLEKLEEVREEGHHALVFSQFTSLLELIDEELRARQFDTISLTGATSAKKRGELVEAFQRGEHDVFLLSLKAGGVGLNLTRASFVFVLDPWWNPAAEDQATDRAHRIGQKNPVTVYRLVTLNTVEEGIYEMQENKRELLDAVMAGAGSSGAVSLEELRAMIAGEFDARALPEEEREEDASTHASAPPAATEAREPLDRLPAKAPSHAFSSLPPDRWEEAILAYFDNLRASQPSKRLDHYIQPTLRLATFCETLDARPKNLAALYQKLIEQGVLERSGTDARFASISARHLTSALPK